MSARPSRKTTRRPVRQIKVPCTLQRTVEEGPWSVTVMIVSTTAIRLRSRQVFRPRMHLSVDLPEASGHPKANLFRVMHGKEAKGTPEWIIDGVFIKKLAQEAVDAAKTRIGPAGCKTVCRLVRVQQQGPWLVSVQNVSHRGIGLLADRPFDSGTFLKVELPIIRKKSLEPKVVRVTYSTPQPGGQVWLVGGVFLRSLTEEELQVLL
jgi:hypothetical protein